MKDSVHDISDYFSHRAARYRFSQEACPSARTLDLLPYAYALQRYVEHGNRHVHDLAVLDAFGGSGFLSKSFSHTPIQFTVADCTSAYALESTSRREVVVCEDYFKEMANTRANLYDLAFAHGGLHHVFVKNGEVECDSSLGLQCHAIANLAAMIRPGGLIVIGDVPNAPPSATYAGADLAIACSSPELDSWIGKERISFLQDVLGHDFKLPPSLRACSAFVDDKFRNRHHPTSLRNFFDQFVAAKTVHGHQACFIDFPRLSAMLEAHRLVSVCRFDYPGAWIFSSREQAVWFFREMFGYGNTGRLEAGIHPEDAPVSEAIDFNLGTRDINGHVAVNWGVTYTIYMKY